MANQTTPELIGTHSVAAGAKDAAAPAYHSANAPLVNRRYDKYLSVFINVSGGAGSVAVTAYAMTKDAKAPAADFGLLGTLTIAHGGAADYEIEYPLIGAGKDIGFYVDDGAGGIITPACTIKVLASSDRG